MQTHNNPHDSMARLWRVYAKYFFFFILFLFVVTLAVASSRMVTAAFQSQPDCILDSPQENGSYGPAKRSC